LRGCCAAPLPDDDRKEINMKTYALALAILGLAAAVPAMAQTTQRPDTGSMAYPTPLPQGNIGTTVVGPRAADTGSMAYPAPLPQGNVGTTTVK